MAAATPSVAAPLNGMGIYEVSPWEHIHPDPIVGPDHATSSWDADHNVDLIEVHGRTEIGAFVLNHASAKADVDLVASDLVGPCGLIPASSVDIRVAKFWYQGEFAWTNIGIVDGTRFTNKDLIPELLLKNPGLIAVDEGAAEENSALSGTLVLNPETAVTGRFEEAGATFSFTDSATLQSFDMEAGRNVWVWAAVTIPDNAGACGYTGTISVDDQSTSYGTVELTLQVRDLSITERGRHLAYYRATLDDASDLVGSETKNLTQLRAELAEFARARMKPIVYEPLITLAAYLDELVTAGLGGGPLYYLGVNANDYTNDGAGNTAFAADVASVVSLATARGFTDVYIYGKDEAHAATTAELGNYAAAQGAGAKIFQADDESVYGIDALLGSPEEIDLLIDAEHPMEASEAVWNSNSREIISYANRQSQIEDTYSVRRNYGLVTWAQGYDGFGIYAFQDSDGHIYADDDDNSFDLRDHVVCYPTRNGCLRTIQLEAYREAVDDYHLLRELEARIALYDNGADAQLDIAADAAQTYLDALEASIEDSDADVAGPTEDPLNLNTDLVAMRATLFDHLDRLNPQNRTEIR